MHPPINYVRWLLFDGIEEGRRQSGTVTDLTTADRKASAAARRQPATTLCSSCVAPRRQRITLGDTPANNLRANMISHDVMARYVAVLGFGFVFVWAFT